MPKKKENRETSHDDKKALPISGQTDGRRKNVRSQVARGREASQDRGKDGLEKRATEGSNHIAPRTTALRGCGEKDRDEMKKATAGRTYCAAARRGGCLLVWFVGRPGLFGTGGYRNRGTCHKDHARRQRAPAG